MKSLLSIILILIIPILGISNNGGDEPSTQKSETVKDQFGIDTGLTKTEYVEFKKDYKIRASKLLPAQNIDKLFKYKIDPTKIKELDKFGVNIYRNGPEFYPEYTLFSDIVVIGSVIGKDEAMDEYTIKIDEILKGEEILVSKLGKTPEKLHFFHSEVILGIDNPIIVQNQKGIYFLDRSEGMNQHKQRLRKVPYSTVLYLDGEQMIYEMFMETYIRYKRAIKALKEHYKSPDPKHKPMVKKYEKLVDSFSKTLKNIESWDTTLSKVKKIIEINDSENFYKKSWK